MVWLQWKKQEKVVRHEVREAMYVGWSVGYCNIYLKWEVTF